MTNLSSSSEYFPGWDTETIIDWYDEASQLYLGLCEECGENSCYGADEVLLRVTD